MNSNQIQETKQWYECSYKSHGLGAQRRYPNEEMLRFLGRNLFKIPNESRKETRVLEVGCGSCSNLWVVAKEGFDAYGIDFSSESIALGGVCLSTGE